MLMRGGFRGPCEGPFSKCRLSALVSLLLALTAASSASAQGIARHFTDQPSYRLELEPHLVAGVADPPGPGVDQGAGLGVRGAVTVSRDGFIGTVNDSIAIGFGLDVLHYRGNAGSLFGSCVRRTPGPGGTSVCTEVDVPGGPRNYFFIPVVMQWNFWRPPQWSAFVEPGLNVFFANPGGGVTPSFAVGGRLHASDVFNIMLRIGWPTTTLGVSFFL
jgi:hypothetical protein